MANYLLVYKGGGMPESPEQQQSVMNAWMSWFGGMGDAVVDGGNPCGPSRGIASDGSISEHAASALTGYSVVKAASLDAATKLAKGCPVLSSGGSVEVYETFNAM
ncbi:MAG: hypothetical protein HY875_08470 [Chloroflexi bacterium]|nr:hypothetical protein [Chloroflexota bacterium]